MSFLKKHWNTLEAALAHRFPGLILREDVPGRYAAEGRSYAAILCGNATVLLEDRGDGRLVPFSGPMPAGDPTGLGWLPAVHREGASFGGLVPDNWIYRESDFGERLLRFTDGPLLHVRLARNGYEVRSSLEPKIRSSAIPEAVIAEELRSRRLTPKAFAALLAVHALRHGPREAVSLLAAVRTVPSP